MNRTIRAIIAVVFVLIITFSVISVGEDLGRGIRLDITDKKLYTLSDGTKAIIAKLNQPVTMQLYYAKSLAIKSGDQLQYFNSYYSYVHELLREYAAESGGMIKYEVIDPRPFSDEEEFAIRSGVRAFPISKGKNFFFGLVLQTEFGVTKRIPFFSPDRQSFIEYDISFLIDTAVTRAKKRVGILSSLSMLGHSPYLARMMQMQGQQPKRPWSIITQLRQQYEVSKVLPDAEEISNSEIDLLLVIHPVGLPEKTIFAIDQFILNGGRAVICVDPHFFVATMDQQQMQPGGSRPEPIASELNKLLNAWGLNMPEKTFAADLSLAISVSQTVTETERLITYLELKNRNLNDQLAVTADLQAIKMFFSGVLEPIDGAEDDSAMPRLIPLLKTSNRGSAWKPSDADYALFASSPQGLDPRRLLESYVPGTEAVTMAYLAMGHFTSAFPEGITLPPKEPEAGDADPCVPSGPRKVTGLTEADNCAVVVFADVDFIHDMLAYSRGFLGMPIAGDNTALLLNSLEELTGSTDLMSIRSRGEFKRPFTVVDKIEARAEARSEQQIAKYREQIKEAEARLREMAASGQRNDNALLESSRIDEERELRNKKYSAQKQIRQINQAEREDIEKLGNKLRNYNMLLGPMVILILAIAIWIRRSSRRRHYVSHASDA